MLAVVVPISNAYSHYWPRVWSEVAGQVKTGAPVGEVVIARPSNSQPSVARLLDALEKVTGRPAPELRECPIEDPATSVGAVRNAGLEHVSQPLVTFMDADDHLAPGIWRELCALHDRHPGLGSAAGASIKRLPDGTITALAARAHRLGRPRQLGPERGWRQVLLWLLSIESPVLAPGGGAVHASALARSCGGYGHSAMEDLVFGAASVSCALACYRPRRVGRLWEIREGSWWSRPHTREELLDAHDEMTGRLEWLADEGLISPALVRAGISARLALSARRRRLARLPDEVLEGVAGPSGLDRPVSGPELSAWIEGAARAELEMADQLS